MKVEIVVEVLYTIWEEHLGTVDYRDTSKTESLDPKNSVELRTQKKILGTSYRVVCLRVLRYLEFTVGSIFYFPQGKRSPWPTDLHLLVLYVRTLNKMTNDRLINTEV